MKKILFTSMIFMFVLFVQPVLVKADTIPEGYYRIRNANSNLYLDAEGLTDLSNIRQLSYPRWIMPQKFLILHQYDGYYSMHAYDAQNMVVDVNNGSSASGANIWLYDTNFSYAQQWKFLNNGDGTFRVMSRCSGGNKAMVVQYASKESGGNVIQYSYNNTLNEKWFLEAAIEEGVYRIKNKKTGLYMAINAYSGSVQQMALDGNNKNQLFKITPSTDGYFDIAPDKEHGDSLGVSGWDLGKDDEWASIYCDYGQSSEGQRWRFLVNEDGSFRIVSELSNCQKAMTADGNYIYSVTYNKDNYSGWELELVSSEYCKEGEHVVLSFDTEKYIKKSVEKYLETSNDTEEDVKRKIKKWIKDLDAAYEAYAELVGATPQNGEKIWVVPSNYAGPNGNYIMYTYENRRIIFVPYNTISYLFQCAAEDDWCFELLHEMGHTFDVDTRWVFHAEFFANFKMAYVLKKCDGKHSVKIQGGNKITKYSDVIKEYREEGANAYTKTIGATPRRTHINGLNYMFLQQLEDNGSWEWVKGAFRNIRNTPVSVANPTTQVDKYNYFLNEINKQSNGVFMRNWLAIYSSEHAYVASEFANGTFQ